ncbi:Pet122p KNAG_0G01690 [Huiozyma naganishii CBS 8797]|uniref:Uncharacterized protein n=1 Tax=Huiozyma naganishii (strain ATCC MYA-139 / BCRC 22969 / CBS 8797 / KCTC 17520 / NBRC 10181 / NCYC 3082 / Yp74L-3) TaxID=1071383 RepID=J7S0Z3_HUIN7|nr:hypothetical protein KNAG_0G01690 [Kazachstania naganishii CBS 8797]CCK71227.1 hypothetical protein KNAG_0G01690 [Kazachstania naganishii CBS 8797]
MRRRLYANCLNRNFDEVLAEVREIPFESMDYNFLKVYLAKSCQWGHTESVNHIWYKYVVRKNTLLVDPELLCSIGNLAIYDRKNFMPNDIYKYYVKHYGREETPKNSQWRYELLRIKTESFARTTSTKTNFREKWKVFLQDMDNCLPLITRFRVRDFPNLVESYRDETQDGKDLMVEYLFEEKMVAVKNPYSLPMLLNFMLLETSFSADLKMSLFKRFFTVHQFLPKEDSVMILVRACSNDAYRLNDLFGFCGDFSLSEMSPRIFQPVKKVFNEKQLDQGSFPLLAARINSSTSH